MKLHQLMLALLFITFIGCKSNKTEIVISGKIEGDIPDKVFYTAPINGVCNWWFTESVEPDSLGNFEIILNSNTPLFVKLRTSYKKQTTLIVEPGKSYEFVFDITEKEAALSMSGKSSVLQETYNKLPNPSHIQDGAREFLRDSLANRIKETVELRKTNEIAEFEKLLSENTITQEVFNLVKTDRACYYNAVMATTMWIKKMQSMRGKENAFNTEFDLLWKEAFQPALFSNTEIQNSTWFNFYAESYINFQEYINGNFTEEKAAERRKIENLKTYNINKAKEYLPTEVFENYLANYLYEESFQKKYEKELIGLFDDFKINYPESEYTPFISPLIDEILKFHKTADSDFNENIHFIDDYENRNTLAELANTFSEGKIYVDVWATWCGPCKAEFKHKKELNQLLQKYNIPVLYISIDREKDAERWENMIKFYNLEGYHVRANDELNKELRTIFDNNGSISIPWYLLLDANGNIIKKHASRPSKLSALKKEISKK